MWLAIRAALGTFVAPAWLPYVAGALIALGAYWYIDSAARTNERAVVVAEHSKETDAAQKHFAERASNLAAQVDALRKEHAATLETRDLVDASLVEQWRIAVEKNKELATQTCWPLDIVKELRK